MSFSDEGIVIDVKPYGETQALAHIFTSENGKRAGLVHGGQGRRMRPLLQPGNKVKVDWRGRGEDSLGVFALELLQAHAATAMESRLQLAGLSAACAIAHAVLPEREVHKRAYTGMAIMLDHLDEDEIWPALMARWELGLLAEMGFGLTLDRCAATGAREDLIYVSPKSGSAVCAEAGAPYKDRMLALPAFLRGEASEASLEEAISALQTTGFFIETRILHLVNKELPEVRQTLLALLLDHAG